MISSMPSAADGLSWFALHADGLFYCRVGGGEDQRPEPVRIDAIVVWVRHRQGQDLPSSHACFRRATWSPTLERPYGAAIP
jgi:hypothetical protein